MSSSPNNKNTRSRGRLVVILLTMATVLSTVPAPASSAPPSTFVQVLCDPALPGGATPAWSFHANPGTAFTPFGNCSQPDGGIGIAQTGQTSATFALVNVSIPETPGGYGDSETISGISTGLSPGNHLSHIRTNGWPGFNTGESQRAFRLRTPAGGPVYFLDGNSGDFTIVMTCDGNVGPCNGGKLAARYIVATQVDPNPPSLNAASGSLFGGGILRGHQDLAAEATDKGGGLSKLEVWVNGVPAPGGLIAPPCKTANVKNLSYEGPAAISRTPCPSRLPGSWTLDTAAYPFQKGINSVQVCASDFSILTEPNRTCTAPQAVEVDNSCTESPIPGGEIISAQFVKSRKDVVTLPPGKTAKVSGEVINNAGDAISGATVCVQMQTQGSKSGLRPVGTATTDANGHFAYKVDPGPNRKILLGYRHDRFQVARSLRFYSHAKVRFKITPGEVRNGGEIKMRGRLPGPGAAGRVAVLQASALRSNDWYTFERATTGRRGVFHARYRFDATSATTIYRIRAVAPRQRGWPWETGYSKPVLVKVRG